MNHEHSRLPRLLILSLVLLALIGWWWLRRRPQAVFTPAFKSVPTVPKRSLKAPAEPVFKEPPAFVVAPTLEIPQPTTAPTPTQSLTAVTTPIPSPEAVAPKSVAPAPADDLTRIEGIGPKIASILQAAGITTFTQLAEAEVSRLKQILQEAGLRLADPGTWPEQAKLAAAGDWDAFKAFKDQLKGGRRRQG